MVIRASSDYVDPKDMGILFDNTSKSIADLKKYENKSIFIKLYNPMCGPCKQLDEYLHSKEFENVSNVVVVSVNTREGGEIFDKLKAEHQIRAVPVFVHVTPNLETKKLILGFDRNGVKDLLKK